MTEQIELGDQTTDGGLEDVLGVPEAIDTDGNGTIDAWLYQLDAETAVVLSDANGDHGADTLSIDTDGDGLPELLVTETPDGYRLQTDEDGDGTFESDGVVSRAEFEANFPDLYSLLNTTFGVSPTPQPTTPVDPSDETEPVQPTTPVEPSDQTEPVQPTTPVDPFDQTEPVPPAIPVDPSDQGRSFEVQDGVLIGDPEGASEHWFEQAANGFCVPASISQIVSEYTGVHLADEQHFVDRANELHLFVVGPDGVPGVDIHGAETLLEDAGVPAEVITDLSIPSLIDFVNDGRAVMLAVDSGELWTGEAVEDEAADHAVVLTGFDLDRGVAILSDPGQPGGEEFEVKISDLEDAWADSGHAALVCDTPPADMPTADFAATGTGADSAADATDDAPEPVAASTTAPDADGQLSRAVSWVVDHPYAVLPVLLGAHLLIPRK
jgi:hypothetical protein